MAFPTKPTSRPQWTDPDSTLRAEPTTPKKNTGWGANERPTRQTMNWLFYNLGTEWLLYFDGVLDQLKGLTANYAAYVGTVGAGSLATHSSLTTALAAINPGDRILVLEDQVLNSTVQITKNNVEIALKPGVTISKGTAATGLQLSANGVRIKGGRFAGFSTTGNIAILVDATALYSMIGEARFASNDTDISDLSGGGATWALINE